MIDRPAIRTRIERLSAALEAHGMRVSVDGAVMQVRNPASEATSPAGSLLHAGLSQRVALCQVDGAPMWCWVWEPPRPSRRGARTLPLEIEAMCPADDIATAVRRITRVLAVRTEEPSDA